MPHQHILLITEKHAIKCGFRMKRSSYDSMMMMMMMMIILTALRNECSRGE
jgi:hypothetical protein